MSDQKYKAVVFDMDGVIFDSERIVLESWMAVAKKYHIEHVDEPYYRSIGVNAATAKQNFLNYYGPDFPYDTYKSEASAWFHKKCSGGNLPVKPGVVEILTWLRENGYLIGLASSTRRGVVEPEIQDAGLTEYFHNLTCGDMLKKSKPEPDIFLMACDNLGVVPEHAIAVEDSYNGIRAAYRAGMCPIMVPDMIAPDKEMRLLAHKICNSLTEVMQWLKGLQ